MMMQIVMIWLFEANRLVVVVVKVVVAVVSMVVMVVLCHSFFLLQKGLRGPYHRTCHIQFHNPLLTIFDGYGCQKAHMSLQYTVYVTTNKKCRNTR
jgi:hypothetical protein